MNVHQHPEEVAMTPMTVLRDAALELLQAGEQVIPIMPGTKRPAIKGWQRAALTPVQVDQLWSQRDYGIGVVTGRGRMVVDIDPRSGGQIDPSWPETMTVRTPSGGWHLHYRTTETIPNSAGRLAKGVDVRGVGGQVLVPPSPGYEWADERRMAELPTQIADVLLWRGGTSSGGRRFEWPDELGQGERNDGLARIAGHLISTGVEDVERELLEVNRWLCSPPLDEREVEQIARSIGDRHERCVR